LLAAIAVTLAVGCRSVPTAEKVAQEVSVARSAAPERVKVLPALNSRPVPRVLISSEKNSITNEVDKRFVAAREAFWNRDTDAAVALWRQLLPEMRSTNDARRTRNLIVDSYETDGRWAEALAGIEEFQTSGSRTQHVTFLKLLESLPRQKIAFDTNAPPVPFSLKLGQLVMANARINGSNATVFVDTGFSMSFVTESFAKRAGLEKLHHTIRLIDVNGGSRNTSAALVNEIQIGGLRVENVPVICGPSGYLGDIVGHVDAVIGWDVLQHADVTWDFPAREMSLSAPSGPRVSDPVLCGRIAPIITVRSGEGRALDLFLDTGYASRPAGVELWENADVLFTKVDQARVRSRWLPTFHQGMNSFRISWPRRIRPFRFWFDGQTFEVKGAGVSRNARVHVREGLQVCDGMIGNAPFIHGRLRVCGARRLVSYTNSTSATPIEQSASSAHQ
jgi:hypothetical protein